MKKSFLILLIALLVTGCGAKPAAKAKEADTVIRIGATPVPHAEILEQLRPSLEEQGFQLEVKTMDDFKLPNTLVEDGSLDANYFQHIPYMLDFNEQAGTHLVDVLKVHYEPLVIYGGSKKTLDEVATGDEVLVPDDATNLSRALKLLEEAGWIELNENKDTATIKDIVNNPKGIVIKEVVADSIAPLIDDVPYIILNVNYALGAKIIDRGLLAESISPETIEKTVNVVAVKEGNEKSEKTLAILKAFEDPRVKEFIKNEFGEAVTTVLK